MSKNLHCSPARPSDWHWRTSAFDTGTNPRSVHYSSCRVTFSHCDSPLLALSSTLSRCLSHLRGSSFWTLNSSSNEILICTLGLKFSIYSLIPRHFRLDFFAIISRSLFYILFYLTFPFWTWRVFILNWQKLCFSYFYLVESASAESEKKESRKMIVRFTLLWEYLSPMGDDFIYLFTFFFVFFIWFIFCRNLRESADFLAQQQTSTSSRAAAHLLIVQHIISNDKCKTSLGRLFFSVI